MQLDKWQKDVLGTAGNIVLRSGRQVGKSTVISIKAAEYAVSNSKKSIMIISATERQAYLLFSKVLAYIHDHHKHLIKSGKEKPTKSEIKLKNGSIIRCIPTGLDGLGIRGYTVDLLIADEAAFIPQEVWPAVTPMLATTGGTIILLSTPFGKGGYFYECFSNPSFTPFHISSPDVAESRDEPQRTRMIEFLDKEQKRMTKLQYAQEYLGEFVDELRQLFPDELIRKTQTLKRPLTITPGRKYFLGVDVARMGEDQSTFEIFDATDKKLILQVESMVTTKTYTTQTSSSIVQLEKQYKFQKIGVDGAGVGAGVFDQLLNEPETRLKSVDLNNATKPLDFQGERSKRLLKEEMYANTLRLMEHNMVKFLDDPEIFHSFKSVQYEYDEKGKIKIFGNNTHIVEGVNRALYPATQDKGLNLWVTWN